MIFKNKNILKSENAQAMVEFILIFPIFIILIFGVIEFALLSLANQNVSFASFKAARSEIVGRESQRSAWMSLYMLTPNWIDNLSPLYAMNITHPEFGFNPVSFNNKFTLLNMVIGTPCLLKLFGAKDPLGDFNVSFTLFDTTVKNTESLINTLLSKLAGAASALVNPVVDQTNETINDVGYSLPPFIRKALYAMSFVEVTKTDLDDNESPSVKVEVTYYYILKFPVIRSIFAYFFENWGVNETPDIFKGTGSKWEKAKTLSDKSRLTFIPITHSCIMGNEKKICP